jgi:tetratricopeptide (TPR) repeat protein
MGPKFLSIIILQVLLTGVTLFALWPKNQQQQAAVYKQAAEKLLAAGVTKEAADNYERYLATSKDNVELANVAWSLAEIYEQKGEAEKALSWLYRAEAYRPNATAQEEISKKIVALLERLGKYQAAKAALDDRTKLGKDKKDTTQGGTVVAEVGNNKIYLHQLDQLMDQIPAGMRSEKDPAKAKLQLLQKYVADELLYQKGERLGLTDDAEIKEKMKFMEKQFVVGRVVQEEMKNKIKISPTDIKTYYQANKIRYFKGEGKNKKALSFEEAKNQVEMDYQMEKARELTSAMIDELIKTEKVKLYPERLK